MTYSTSLSLKMVCFLSMSVLLVSCGSMEVSKREVSHKVIPMNFASLHDDRIICEAYECILRHDPYLNSRNLRVALISQNPTSESFKALIAKGVNANARLYAVPELLISSKHFPMYRNMVYDVYLNVTEITYDTPSRVIVTISDGSGYAYATGEKIGKYWYFKCHPLLYS